MSTLDCSLTVKVIPGAKKSQVIGMLPDGIIRLKLAAPPVEGKANALLIKWIADLLEIKTAKITITHGEKSRIKTMRLEGISCEQAISKILENIDSTRSQI